ncbi:DegT/DnrJ/EryC1/StrS family aminotransferase [Rickettsiales endosymbiont of Stachyamoeba lipophora]|uniref:DegT/DnrJ/EryC1/StrS family aminotransferase n=1 Tax=Rickettsiales endosymbiont of Stachyamoeba lipophora TaxID=2486578 RepID=UPI000F646DE9|nr:aminotransferase class I/II-fold pyridoxal phosphate-dependent enzyme [Rickettsiales endosymbiont of Stachyamoeba lipophora]AZL15487.1 aminotransferase class I/II-fold pyridoxal phosphate-dependent enzyme [Rickettsiales endosymbiont of Stachyamoeba lipophora]
MDQHIQNIFENVIEYCKKNYNFQFNPNNPVVRLHEPTFGAEEINALIAQLMSTNVTMGPRVKQFEENYCTKFGHKYGVSNNSGSSANLLAVAALTNPAFKDHLRPGDEVIVPALSWSTTVWPIIQCGLIPVFVDCDINTFNLDLNKLEQAITPKTRAIKLVHVYGNPCHMDEIMALARKHNLFIIEDSCESMGATYKGKYVGTFGDIGTFSFYYSHHITTLEGGISVTNNFELAELMRVLRAHGWTRQIDEREKYEQMHADIDPRFIFINLGYNLRLTEIQAAMGIEQFKKFDDLIAVRKNNAKILRRELEELSDLFSFQNITAESESTWFGFSLILKEKAKFTKNELGKYLHAQNIENRPIIAGNMSKHPALQMYEHKIGSTLENSNNIMDNGIAVGCHHAMNEEACLYITNHIKQFVKEHANHTSNLEMSAANV